MNRFAELTSTRRYVKKKINSNYKNRYKFRGPFLIQTMLIGASRYLREPMSTLILSRRYCCDKTSCVNIFFTLTGWKRPKAGLTYEEQTFRDPRLYKRFSQFKKQYLKCENHLFNCSFPRACSLYAGFNTTTILAASLFSREQNFSVSRSSWELLISTFHESK